MYLNTVFKYNVCKYNVFKYCPALIIEVVSTNPSSSERAK